MWQDKLKEVIYILENSDINEIEVRFWFRKIKVTKKPPIINSDISNLSPNVVTSTPDKPSDLSDKEDVISPKVDANTFTVRSPMPGTFYSSPDPDSDSFISLELLTFNEDELAIVEFENRKITKRNGAININLKWVEVIVILSRSNKVFISLSLNEITM